MAIAGARGYDTPSLNSGKVIIYRLSGGNWAQEQIVTPSVTGFQVEFGHAVATQGDWAMVGAHRNGRVFFYEHSGGTWTEEHVFAFGDRHGHDVDMNGTWAIAGEYREDVGSEDEAGAARIYQLSGGVWSLHSTLTAPTPDEEAYFGSAVAISSSGFAAVIDDAFPVPRLYIYELTAGSWNLLQTVDYPTAPPSQKPQSLAFEDRTLVVGVPSGITGGVSDGFVDVYTYNGTDFDATQLSASDGTTGDLFGVDVAINETQDTIIVGADGDDDASTGTVDGSFYMFVNDGSGWSQPNEFFPDVPIANQRFGGSVAMSGGNILIGSLSDNPGGVGNAGSVYIFGEASAPLSIIQLDLHATPQSDHVHLHWQLPNVQQHLDLALERRNGTSKFQSIAESLHANEFDDFDTRSNATYYYRLRMTDADGQHTYSQVVTAALNGSSDASLQVFPNPVSEQLQCLWHSEFGTQQHYSIYNHLGQVVQQGMLHANSAEVLDVEHLPTGTYVLQLQDGSGLLQRFVKQ